MILSNILEKNKKLAASLLICAMTVVLGGCGGAEKSYDQGMELFEKGDYTKACDAFSEAITKNPDMADYYIGYGMSLLGLGEYDKAREQFLFVVRDTDNKIVRENNKKAYRGIALTYYKSGVYDQAQTLMEKMTIKDLATRKITQVSGGQLQRACICRSMMNSPEILFADEPTGALNKSAAGEVINEFVRLNREGTSVLMVTHDAKVACCCNRILYLSDGRVCGELDLSDLGISAQKQREDKVNKWLFDMNW